MTDEYFNLASTCSNCTRVPSQDSASNEEGIATSECASVVSHSVTLTDPSVQDISDNDSSRISKEANTSVSEECGSITSEEGGHSVSEEG